MNDTHVYESLAKLVAGNEWPKVNSVVSGDCEASMSLFINDDISWFAGHFPEQAVLPGVVQVHWATQLAKYFFAVHAKKPLVFKAANNVKFKTMILPGQQVDLVLRYKSDKNSVSFHYQQGDEVFSTGSLVFE